MQKYRAQPVLVRGRLRRVLLLFCVVIACAGATRTHTELYMDYLRKTETLAQHEQELRLLSRVESALDIYITALFDGEPQRPRPNTANPSTRLTRSAGGNASTRRDSPVSPIFTATNSLGSGETRT